MRPATSLSWCGPLEPRDHHQLCSAGKDSGRGPRGELGGGQPGHAHNGGPQPWATQRSATDSRSLRPLKIDPRGEHPCQTSSETAQNTNCEATLRVDLPEPACLPAFGLVRPRARAACHKAKALATTPGHLVSIAAAGQQTSRPVRGNSRWQ